MRIRLPYGDERREAGTGVRTIITARANDSSPPPPPLFAHVAPVRKPGRYGCNRVATGRSLAARARCIVVTVVGAAIRRFSVCRPPRPLFRRGRRTRVASGCRSAAGVSGRSAVPAPVDNHTMGPARAVSSGLDETTGVSDQVGSRPPLAPTRPSKSIRANCKAKTPLICSCRFLRTHELDPVRLIMAVFKGDGVPGSLPRNAFIRSTSNKYATF